MAASWWWATGFTLVSLAANIAILLGCLSPATKDVCLYRVSPALLAEGLYRLAFQNNHNVSELHAADLPTYWYWGASGICDVYLDETHCRRAFPPTQSLLTIIEDSLRNHLEGDKQQLVTTIVSSWNATLNKIGPTILVDKEAKFAAQSKASVALFVIAVVMDFAIPFIALAMSDSANRYSLYSVISSLVAVAAGILAILSMNNGVHGAVDTGEHGGPAILVLFVAAGLRIISSLSGSYYTSSRHPTKNLQGDRDYINKEIGYRGEHYLYHLFRQHIYGWSYENWTSGLRNWSSQELYPVFTGSERDHADFTYIDYNAQMQNVLRNFRVQIMPQWSRNTKYHLEVKTTPGECSNIFYVSSNQVRLMQMYDQDPHNAYIIARVFRCRDDTPCVRFFPNPWSLERHGYLYFGEPNAEGYYPVTITWPCLAPNTSTLTRSETIEALVYLR